VFRAGDFGGAVNASAHTTEWDRHAILAAIRRRYGSMTQLAERCGVTVNDLSVALGSPFLRGEAVIAAAIDVPARELWPDRYMPDGRRRRFPSRRQPADASQKQALTVDGERA
jgi:Ner family transcriptional regulator